LKKIPIIFLAVLIQAIAFGCLVALVWLLPLLIEPPYNPLFLSLIMGLMATLFSYLIKLPKWWLWLQLFFPIIAYLVIREELNPLYGLLIFVLLLLIFSNSFVNRVPLYLTNTKTRLALSKLIKDLSEVNFIDLGSGLGGNVVYMFKQPQVKTSVGVETAPLPYLLSKINCFLNGGEIYAEDLWTTSLQNFNLVYVFLSPQPMPKLWQKIVVEMDKDSVLVSNSFSIPGVTPSEIWELSDRRKTNLYIYYLKDFKK
jgi:hypothetical protein